MPQAYLQGEVVAQEKDLGRVDIRQSSIRKIARLGWLTFDPSNGEAEAGRSLSWKPAWPT